MKQMSDEYRSLDDAVAFVKSALPGWGWRVSECSVSDDAFVFPDFNCPVHGERLKATVPVLVDGIEWSDFTDIDQRPPGDVAGALMQSAMLALAKLEEMK